MNNLMTTTESRRKFFGASAKVLGMGAVAVAGLEAQSTASTDIDILNYALRLENLESAFYTQGLAKFAASDFANSDIASTLGTRVSASLYGYFQAIQQHESTHVNALTGAIQQLGGTPIATDCYNFGFTTADAFISTAQVLENTGVMAYDGAIALVKNPALVQVGATIATVEARHAAYLNLLARGIPFPAPFDSPQTMAQILAAAGGFINSCPTGPGTGPGGAATKAVASPKALTTAMNQVALDGSSSTSFDGQALRYLWSIRLGSPNASLSAPSSAMTTITFKGGPGSYFVSLQVWDSQANMFTDNTKITYTGS